MDGTLTDSMPLHNQAWLEALATLGIHPDPAEFIRMATGWPSDTIVRAFVDAEADEAAVARVVAIKAPIFTRLMASQLRFLPGAEAFLEAARGAGFKLALATAAGPDSVGIVCRALDLPRHFDAILCRADVERGKPAPDLFLKAAERLGAHPDECLVFEDSTVGLEASLAASMRTCVLLTALKPDELRRRNYPHVVAAAPDFTGWEPRILAGLTIR